VDAEAMPDIDALPVVDIPVDSLLPADSPRLAGQDARTIALLAQLDGPLPPILVHQGTRRVIDGMHRLLAARLRGEKYVAARFYECDPESVFVLSVQANVTHGLPLSLADRKAAAARIVHSHPHWSSRRIAKVAGLSDKTVGMLRTTHGQEQPPGEVTRRVGIDGRSRPVPPPSSRTEPDRRPSQGPEKLLRQVGRPADLSLGKVHPFRDGLTAGSGAPSRAIGLRPSGVESDPGHCLRALMRDPALRSTDSGRTLLRMLSSFQVVDQNSTELIACVPEHGLMFFESLARANAELWRGLADLAARREKLAA
jgi:hypothetical protein